MKRDIWFKSVRTSGSKKRRVMSGIVPLFLDFAAVVILPVMLVRQVGGNTVV